MQPSPYTPGTVASVVAGRDKHIRETRRDLAMMEKWPSFSGCIEVFVGPRGVGKTSLLRLIQATAEELNFQTIWVTAGDGDFLHEVSSTCGDIARTWKSTAADKLRSLIKSTTISIPGLSISSPAAAATDDVAAPSTVALKQSGNGRKLQQILETTWSAAKSQKRNGIVLFIDEIQLASADSLRALAYAWQHMQSEASDMPIMAMTAGLSHSQDVITDAVSFAERFRYHHLYNLTPEAAQVALLQPAEKHGVFWSNEARDHALVLAHGYPYFLQLIGDLCWRAADFPDAGMRILPNHLTEAEEEFEEARESLFRSRWNKATEREKEIMSAMATLGTPQARRADIASVLGVPSDAIGMARRSLMDKGLLESSRHGYLEFTVPGFAEFVLTEHGG